MAQVKATFYLPIRDNDGRDLQLEIARVEDRCFEEFGGWTMSGYFRGTWRMQTGERSLDTSAVYVVVLPEDQLELLERILREFKAETTQEAIYLEVDRDVEIRFL